MEPWYDRAFGGWYARLYPHRDATEAERAIAVIVDRLPPEGTVLDVGCGAGRHARILAAAGRSVVGLDRSPTLLTLAAGHPELAGNLVRADMRELPFADHAFSSVISMFTSFGYFRTREAHVRLLAGFGRVVHPRGRLVLDYLNEPVLRRDLVPESRRTVDGHAVLERRGIHSTPEGETVVKEISIRNAAGREVERYREEVALYDRDTLLGLLQRAGWAPTESLGDYDGRPWTAEAARLLVIAERGEP